MSDDARSRTLAELRRMVQTLDQARADARRAQDEMDNCSERVRAALTAMETYQHLNLIQASDVFVEVQSLLEYAIQNMGPVSQWYGDAMEKAQRAATGIVTEAQGSTNLLPHQAIAAAASAQLSWAEASGHVVAAIAGLQTALTTPQLEVEAKIREAAGMMLASDNSNMDAQSSYSTVERVLGEYEQTI